jgi:hypothetical protein
VNVVLPIMAMFQERARDLVAMIKWMKLGIYVSRNTERQRQLFGDLPSVEEAARRYCADRKLV